MDGGLCGLSAAPHLAEAGHSVRLLGARSIGHGASGRNGGQVKAGLKGASDQAGSNRAFQPIEIGKDALPIV
ncbi:MAG TPA: FAD-dependent oxidoreductase [Alphaproteobacteria bacterium]|nr:FAD-dependent oxidoreductase [Alphaproteobacteria bacterium]